VAQHSCEHIDLMLSRDFNADCDDW